MISVEKFVVNPLGENSFLLFDATGECVFVDPGFYYDEELTEISDYIRDNNLKPLKIVNTHCHFDHIMGVEFIREKYRVPFCAHPEDAFLVSQVTESANIFGFEMKPVSPIDEFLTEGDQVVFGNTEMEVIHVPGHSPGHIVFYNAENRILIAGDVLFYGSIGRADLPGGNYELLISGIKEKLLVLPDDTRVYSGHGPETTIGFEKMNNPFLI